MEKSLTHANELDIFAFGPAFCKTKVSNETITYMMEEGLKCKEKSNTTLAGHIDKEYKYPIETWQKWLDEFKKPFWGYTKFLSENFTVKSAPIEPQPKFTLGSMWINFMRPGDFNPLHRHTGDFSFVCYLDVPKAIAHEVSQFEGNHSGPGTIEFIFGQVGKGDIALTNHWFLPERGDLFIFPACLSHTVAPFKSNVERVSISGNIFLEYDTPLPSK